MPYATNYLLISQCLRVVALIVSYWKPGICKHYLYFVLLHNMVKETLPVDKGPTHGTLITFMGSILFAMYGFGFYRGAIGVAVFEFYVLVIVPYYVYLEDDFKKLIVAYVARVITTTMNIAVTYIMMTWIGFKFIKAEIPRESNHRLLDDLKEGIFIVDEENDEVLFKNKAAVSINSHLESHCRMSMLNSDEEVFDRTKPKFEPVNMADFMTAKSAKAFLEKLNNDQSKPSQSMD